MGTNKFIMNKSTLIKLGKNPYINGKKLNKEHIGDLLNRTIGSKGLLYVLEIGEKTYKLWYTSEKLQRNYFL